MSESEDVATAHEPEAAPAEVRVHDEEDRLRPSFVRDVLDAVADGDDETARSLVADLHPADIADLIELGDERGDLIEALAGIVDADVYAELNDWVREDVIDEMEPQQVADLAAQLDTDDAVALIEDLDQDDQLAILRAMEPDDRAAVEEALTYGEETAGRLMQRDLIAVPEHWNVRSSITCARPTSLATDFWEVFVVAPNHHPSAPASCRPSLRSPRSVPIGEIMVRKQTLIPVDMDQEEVALKFQKYALISAAVVDSSGRLVGMITVDDIVHIIQEEAGEDAAVRREGDINEPVFDTYRARSAGSPPTC